MKRILALSWIACLFFCSEHIVAQHTLSLRVVQAEDGSVLEGAQIYHRETESVEMVDEDGRLEISNVPAGLNYFTVFANEFETLTDSLNVQGDMEYTFRLNDLSISLSAVDVFAKKEELFAIKRLEDIEGTSVFAGKKTEVVVMDLTKGNLANNVGRQVFAQIAGLNIYEGSDGGLQMNLGGRGLDPNRTANFNTRQNGYDISADVLGYPENYYTPPSEAIAEVRMIKGASSLQYGTQFGGLIDFRLRKIESFKKHSVRVSQTLGSFGAYNAFASLGLNKGKSSFNGFYNYKSGDGYRANSDYKAHNAFFSYDLKLSEKSSLGAEFTYFTYLAQQAGGLTDEQFAIDSRLSTRERNWFEVDWKLYNLHFEHDFSKRALFSLSLFALDAERNSLGYRGNPANLNENPITSLDEQDAEGNFILPRDLILGEFKNFGAEARFLRRYSVAEKKAVLLVGSKFFKSNNTSIQGPGSLGSDADFNLYSEQFPDYASQSNFKFPNLNASLFAENIFYLSDKFSLTPGFRFEYIKTESVGDYNQVVFDNAGNSIANTLLSDDLTLERAFVLLGLGLSYKKNERLNWVGNISQNYRSVTFSDIRVVSPTFIIDPDISDEKGITADIGINGRLDKILSYDFTLYSVLYQDRIGIILDDKANRVRKNIGRAIIIGTESLINANLRRWWHPENTNYDLNAFVNAAFTFSEYLSSEENNVVGKRVEFIPIANLKAGLSARYKMFDLSFQQTYLSKQYTDVQNSEVAAAGDKKNGVVGPTPAYTISDLTLNCNLKSFKIGAGINNLFDETYFTRRATGYPGPGIIPSDGRSFFVSLTYVLD